MCYNQPTMRNTFLNHRKALERRLPDGLILVSGGGRVARNHDVDFVFRQNSNFLYLTGVEEPDCLLLIDPRRGRHTLFIPRIDNHHRIWLGHVPGAAEAKALFGFSRVLYGDELGAEVKKARAGYKKFYADAPMTAKLRKASVGGFLNFPAELKDALEELRACKTPGEIDLMRRSSLVSGQAHRAVMRAARPGLYEHQVQAVFESECLKAGLKHLAYPSIVATGVNPAVLHYHRNNAKLRDGDLLLIDAGAEEKGYGADITRTFPVNGKFTQRQRDIYSIVLETQKKCIAASRPGIVSAELHVMSMTFIAEGLKSLKILKGSVQELVETGAVRVFYPHGLTHMLGLDVHDVTGGRKRKLANPTKVPVRFVARLEPGFVITMEPGIYFIEALLRDKDIRRKHKATIDFARAEKFLDFGGVRIEDDIVIQAKGPPLNLTDVPKEIAEVEATCCR